MTRKNVCFIGHLINGKTTSAEYLETVHNYKRMAFARDVKYASASMLTAFSQLIHSPPREVTVEELEKRKKEPEVRQFLQMVGTEIGKIFFNDSEVWVNRIESKLETELDAVVIDDCRFPNEQEMLKRKGFIFVKVIRPDYEQILIRRYLDENPNAIPEEVHETVRNMILHASEIHIDSLHYDYEITATDTTILKLKIEETIGAIIAN